MSHIEAEREARRKEKELFYYGSQTGRFSTSFREQAKEALHAWGNQMALAAMRQQEKSLLHALMYGQGTSAMKPGKVPILKVDTAVASPELKIEVIDPHAFFQYNKADAELAGARADFIVFDEAVEIPPDVLDEVDEMFESVDISEFDARDYGLRDPRLLCT